MTDLRDVIKDAAYVGIGFGVLAFQKLQVQRQELQKRLAGSAGDARTQFAKLGEDVQDRLKVVEERLEALGKSVDTAADEFEERLDKALDEVQSRLPEQAKDLFVKARSAGKEYRTQVRKLARVNGTAAPKATTTAA